MHRYATTPVLPALALALLASGPPQDTQQARAARDAVATVGKPAPAFRLNNHLGRAVEIGGKAKTWTALAFYPKAGTPG
jgi:hypothetical protein